MDILSLVGIALALGAILGGNAIEGGQLSSLLQITAFIIVIGGTLGAVLLQTPMTVFMQGMKLALWIFFPPKVQAQEAIEKIVEWSNVARKEGLLGLEAISEGEPDLFIRKGLQLLVDGSEPDTIRNILEVELGAKEHSDTLSAKIFEAGGGYAPTIGILGAVMGLIHVMQNLSDPSKLGEGIATAFVATIYGVGSANLFLLPIANKLKTIIHSQSQYREMVIEGIISIAEGENPRNIEAKLRGYLT